MHLKFVSTIFLLLSLHQTAFACPKIGAFPDFNCDQTLEVTVIGDSLVAGIGDTANGNRGGYVLRTSRSLKSIKFTNLGVPGYHATDLLADVTGTPRSKRSKNIWNAVRTSDVIVLDLGRNDRWKFGPAEATFQTLRKIATIIDRRSRKDNGSAPYIVTAVLMIPNRGSQAPWVQELNNFILNNSRPNRPGDLRFDLVSKRLLNEDMIHPTPAGYDAIAEVLKTYLTKTIPSRMKKLRPDKDRDGLFDLFETLLFATDPLLFDTDGDGISDGDEFFSSLQN